MTLTIEDAIIDIQDSLGYRKDKTNEIRNAIIRSQRLLEQGKTQPWFLIDSVNVDLLEGESNVAYPTNYNRISRDYAPYIPTTGSVNRTYLKELVGDTAAQIYYGSSTDASDLESVAPGAPRAFALLPLTLRFYPEPDADYIVRLTYYKHAEELSESVLENEWTLYGFDALVAHAGMRMARRLRNQEALANFTEQWSECSNSLFRQFILREDDERDIYAGSVF